MKNFVAVCISCFVFLTQANAQMDLSIAPKTSKLSANILGKVSEIVVPPFSKEQTEQFDYNDTKNGHMPVMARNIAVNINTTNAGSWTELPNGDRIWRVEISAAGAQGIVPLFDQLYLPPGATLHAYMPGKEEVLGAFTNDNTPETRSFCFGLIHGDRCVLEYYEPQEQKGKGKVSLDKVGYAYRWVSPLAKSMKSGSGACEVNVACPEGNAWANQKRSVARIFVVSDAGEGFCSGAMVNNVRKDCTPYMLSAEHCTEGGVSTTQYGQWVFYFNYQAATCADTVGPQTDMVNGCKKIADSEDGGGNSGSDFLLLQLYHTPPSAYNIYYSGWDITNTTPATGVGIHHPNADIKKISSYSSAAQSISWGNIAQNTHWQVIWASTVSGHGVTEPGSSGSPLYNPNSLIVGHLTGGASCCTLGGCGSDGIGPTSPDAYGKVAYDWTSDGVTSAVQLKPWLDPDNTGSTTLQGMNPPCGSAVPNDVGMQAIPEPSGTVCSGTVTPVVVLRNFGSNTLSSATINYKYDNGSTSSFSWTGTLFAGNTVNVTLPTATLSAGAHTFAATASAPNGLTDANSSNNSLTSNFFVSGPTGSLLLALTTDNSGTKTTWQIADASTNVVASGGPYPNLSGGTTYDIPICLASGCYTFTIFSSTNNGMTDGENGNYVLTDAGNTSIFTSLSNPAFGSHETRNFCVTPSAVNEVPTLSFSIIPNPSTGQFNLVINSNEEKTVRVYDVTGRIIKERKTIEQNFMLDLSSESRGVYILDIETANGKAVQKLVLK